MKTSIVKQIVLSGMAGTTTMTLYSYFLSRIKEKRFREPQILNYLIYGKEEVMMGPVEKSRLLLPGFLIHYGTGILFSSFYHLLWKKRVKAGTVKSGIGCGLILGLVGASIWKSVFMIHPNPPKINQSSYLGQLIIAHLIFGATVALCSENRKQQKKEDEPCPL